MQQIYTIPGLGFDHRIFSKIDFGSDKTTHLDWLEPMANESLSEYAQRFSKSIDTKDKIVIVGHSFGGILAQELSRIIDVESIILISSVRHRRELPLYLKMVKPFQLHHFFNKAILNMTLPVWGPFHDYDTKDEQRLFKSMVKGHTNRALKWQLKTISTWKEQPLIKAPNIYQLHGAKDRTLPIKRIEHVDFEIQKGGHFMVYNKPQIIGQILADILAS